MSTMEDVKAAESIMQKAHQALRNYLERESQGQDITVHGRLVEELKKATDNYIQAIIELDPK